VSSFCNCQTANDEDVIALQLKSAEWDATFSVLPSRTQKSRGDNCCVAAHHCCMQLKRKLNNQTILLFYSTSSLESFLWTLVDNLGVQITSLNNNVGDSCGQST
jgi:hypothetical protein